MLNWELASINLSCQMFVISFSLAKGHIYGHEVWDTLLRCCVNGEASHVKNVSDLSLI